LLKAEEKQISVALGTILSKFDCITTVPIYWTLSQLQTQFGMWCCCAIHDTSSVVGAASKYGSQALEIATTVKLARALFIPIAFFIHFFPKQRNKIKIPYFGCLLFAMIAEYLPTL
jgi:uncharacterized membrane protein YadS